MSRGILAGRVHYGDRRIEESPSAEASRFKTRRVADADEDHVTLAVAVLREYLAEPDTAGIGELFLVGRFSDEDASVVLESIGEPEVPVSLYAGTPDAAADALLVAQERDGDRPTVVVASDDGRMRDSRIAGACAALVAVGIGGSLSITAEAHLRVERNAPGHKAHLVAQALEQLEGFNRSKCHVVVAEQTPGEAHDVLGDDHGLQVDSMPTPRSGSVGCAAPLVALVAGAAMHEANDLLWVVSSEHAAIVALFCGTRPTAMHKPTPEAKAHPIDLDAAQRAHTVWADGGRPAQGAFVSRQAYLSQTAARYRLVGQTCDACNTVTFPPRECCPKCAATTLSPTPLSGKGQVYARTQIGVGGAPTEFAPLQEATGPYPVFIVALAEGPRVAAMGTAGTAGLEIDAPLRLGLRLLYVQDHLARYGFKAIPA